MNKKDLRKQTRKSLLVLATQKGLTGVSRLRKEGLIARLTKSPSAKPASTRHSPQVQAAAKPASTRRFTPMQAVPDQQSGAPETVIPPAPTAVVLDQPSAAAVQPVNEVQREAMDSKFFLGPEGHAPLPSSLELPWTYNDNCLVLLARDPYWLYAYWDFNVEQISAAHARVGMKDAQLILRLFDMTAMHCDGTNAGSRVDVELPPFTTNWYVSVPWPDTVYCVEVGYRAVSGQFAALGRSNTVTTPRAEVSTNTEFHWFTPSEPQPVLPPLPQGRPLPLWLIAREPGSWSLGFTDRAAPAPLPLSRDD